MKTKQFKATACGDTFGHKPTLDGFPRPRQVGDKQYDRQWAYALSMISGWAYAADGQMLTDQLPYYGFPECTVTQLVVRNEPLLIVATAYFIQSKDERFAVLAFRGTEPTSLMNWLTDADTALYPWVGGTVHSGFYRNVEAVWDDLVEVMGAAKNVEELYITGHSLGAAMAVIAAERLFEQSRMGGSDWSSRIRGVYTYGQPMVGDADFANQARQDFGEFLFRHIYRYDVVPCVPPREMDTKFAHFGHRYTTDGRTSGWRWDEKNADRRARLIDLAGILNSFITRRIDMLNWIPVPYSLDDHSPNGYIDTSLSAIAPGRVVTVGHGNAFAQLVRSAVALTPRLPRPRVPGLS